MISFSPKPPIRIKINRPGELHPSPRLLAYCHFPAISRSSRKRYLRASPCKLDLREKKKRTWYGWNSSCWGVKNWGGCLLWGPIYSTWLDFFFSSPTWCKILWFHYIESRAINYNFTAAGRIAAGLHFPCQVFESLQLMQELVNMENGLARPTVAVAPSDFLAVERPSFLEFFLTLMDGFNSDLYYCYLII